MMGFPTPKISLGAVVSIKKNKLISKISISTKHQISFFKTEDFRNTSFTLFVDTIYCSLQVVSEVPFYLHLIFIIKLQNRVFLESLYS